MDVQFKVPERCLLVQAALYISESKLPISDAAYLSAPDHLVTCPKELIRALREKLIVARGNLFEAFRTSEIDIDTALAFRPFKWPVIENVEIDAELWSEPWVDIMHSTLIGKNADISRCYKIAPLDSDFLLEHAWDEDEKPVAVETAFMFADITVATAELFQLLSPPPDTIVEQKSKGGRPAKYDWQGFWTELVVRADLDDLPDTQAGCVRVMASWCLEKWDNEPTDSLLREKIAPIYNHPRKKIN